MGRTIHRVDQCATIKGRGALSNRESRFQSLGVEWDDGVEQPLPATEYRPEQAGTIIATNQSPDIPFYQSINPYRGCEHGCIYCYARPTHAFLDLSPGLDFETRISYKANAAEVLESTLASKRYRCRGITLGANTDPYQPAERSLGITRQVLEVLQRHRHPVSIITRSALIARDLDILGDMAERGLASVAVSVTTLDDDLKRAMEPRAPSARARLAAVRQLSQAGVPVSVMFAPVIPALNDKDMEQVVEQAAAAGAHSAAYIFLRLPLEVRDLFYQWLQEHYPDRVRHVISLIRQSRGGQDSDSRFGKRMSGEGPFADLFRQRFALACRRHGIGNGERHGERTDLFRVPPRSGDQLGLF